MLHISPVRFYQRHCHVLEDYVLLLTGCRYLCWEKSNQQLRLQDYGRQESLPFPSAYSITQLDICFIGRFWLPSKHLLDLETSKALKLKRAITSIHITWTVCIFKVKDQDSAAVEGLRVIVCNSLLWSVRISVLLLQANACLSQPHFYQPLYYLSCSLLPLKWETGIISLLKEEMEAVKEMKWKMQYSC